MVRLEGGLRGWEGSRPNVSLVWYFTLRAAARLFALPTIGLALFLAPRLLLEISRGRTRAAYIVQQ